MEEDQTHLPRLMLPCIGNGQLYYSQFHNISDRSVHHKDLHFLHKKRCVGSSHGWLIMVDGQSPSIFAVNPLRKLAYIHLPSLLSFPDIIGFNDFDQTYSVDMYPRLGIVTSNSSIVRDAYLKKVFLSKDPTEEGCMAMAIFGDYEQLAFCRVGQDQEWKFISRQNFIHGYEDVAFDQEGRFYAVNRHGVVVTGDLKTPLWELVYMPLKPDYGSRKKYLVFDARGQLMLIKRYIGESKKKDEEDCEEEFEEDNEDCEEETNEESRYGPCFKTSRFRVFKLYDEAGILEEIDSLKDGVVFLGDNQSLCLSSMEFKGCKSDCIYFTDDDSLGNIEPRIGAHDIGVFNLKDGSIERLKCIEDEADRGIWPPPVWVTLPLLYRP